MPSPRLFLVLLFVIGGLPATALAQDAPEGHLPAAPDDVDEDRRVVEEVAAATADRLGVLPTGDGAATCPSEAIEVVWTPIRADDFTVGGYLEPLSPPTEDDPDLATGIARCMASDHAVAGFDALRDDDGTWSAIFPMPGHEGDEDIGPDEGFDGADAPLDLAPAGSSAGDARASLDTAAGADSPVVDARSSSATGAMPSLATTTPDWPAGLAPTADPLAAYDAQDTCSPTVKPGAAALADLLERVYGNGGPYWVTRACSQGATSEHKEGRALDWMLDPGSSREVDDANAFTAWLLQDDPWGVDHGGARRMGVMYMIWNRRIWGSYRADDGWRDYTGWSPHTDHVHLSLSWDGADCATTWWVVTQCSGREVAGSSTTPAELQAPPSTARADFDGDGFDDVLWYRPGGSSDPMDFGSPDGLEPGLATSVGGTYVPLNGDYDGDGRSDILWYGPGRTTDSRWEGTTDGQFRKGLSLSVGGSYRPAIGDFDGDGRDDVLWYGPGSRPDNIWYSQADGGFDKTHSVDIRGRYLPVVADVDGDGHDDVVWFGRGTRTDHGWFGRSDREFDKGRLDPLDSTGLPVPGDFDGDGRDDVVFYGAGSDPDLLLRGRADGTFAPGPSLSITGHYRPVAGDFDGDGRDDVLWYGPNATADWTYYGTASGFDPVEAVAPGDYRPVASG